MQMEAELSYETSVKLYLTTLGHIQDKVYICTAARAIINSLQAGDKFNQWDTAISDDTKSVVPRDMSVPLSTPHGDRVGLGAAMSCQ
jgi:hypothetical protein